MKGKTKRTANKTFFRTNQNGQGKGKKKTSSKDYSYPDAAKNRRHDPTLGRYFQELADHEVLDSDSETAAAKEIASLEIDRWGIIFQEPSICVGLLEHIIEIMSSEYDAEEVALLRPVLADLKRKAKNASQTARSHALYQKTVMKVAARLHEFDIKRVLVEAAHQQVLHQGTLSKGRAKRSKLPSQTDQLKQITAKVETAKHHFIQANLRLVVAIARRYDRGQMPLIDLIQEGNLGLIKAVERFDYRRGFRFSTYASWWIRHAIGRALADKGHAVRVPVHALDTQHRLARAAEMIGVKLGRPPTDDELAKEAGIDQRRLAKARRHPVVPVCSLDREVSDSDDRRYVDLLADEEGKSPFESTMLRAWTNEMDEVLGVLTPMEQSIIRWRYGLGNGEELTLKEIGDYYNLSRERIRQLQEQALRKIRRHLALDAA